MDTTETANTIDTINITSANTTIGGPVDWGPTPSPYISSGYTIGPLQGGTGSTGTNAMWTTNSTAVDWSTLTVGSVTPSATLTLNGDNADIDINGKSLMKTLEALEHRLNWLQPNPDMEAEWDELRELGERYRELEKKCREKGDMWAKLKAMPAPIPK